ncbi:MAG: glutaredoxin [Lachnospiraceae bacterium]|nr:glutaredoxin [Lachnospiraceae bacterium]
MKVTVIGSHLCPDTLYALNQLAANKADIEFKNLSASLPDLKVYLAQRENNPLYAAVRENGGIGIPCFVLEDGTTTLDLNDVLNALK